MVKKPCFCAACLRAVLRSGVTDSERVQWLCDQVGVSAIKVESLIAEGKKNGDLSLTGWSLVFYAILHSGSIASWCLTWGALLRVVAGPTLWQRLAVHISAYSIVVGIDGKRWEVSTMVGSRGRGRTTDVKNDVSAIAEILDADPYFYNCLHVDKNPRRFSAKRLLKQVDALWAKVDQW